MSEREYTGSGLVSAPLFRLESWQLDLAVLFRKPVIDGGEDLRHHVLRRRSRQLPGY